MTLLSALISALRASADHNRAAEVPPEAVLWTDKERQWEPLLPQLLSLLPQLVVLGPYKPGLRSGPAIWLRCLIGGLVPEAAALGKAVPILYLPGVSRSDLRALDDCPPDLQPLAELQFRGAFFSHTNGKDWSVHGFLTSTAGLALEVAQDADTLLSLRRILPRLATLPVTELAGGRLDVDHFQALLSADFDRDVLRWLNDPTTAFEGWSENDVALFRDRCRRKLGLDTVADGPMGAADRLAAAAGPWAALWMRFEEAPASFPRLSELLERAATPPLGTGDLARYSPRFDRQREDQLRRALLAVPALPVPEAVNAVLELEERHGLRRAYVWARLGRAPLAMALRPLAELARVVRQPCGGASPEALAEEWRTWGSAVDQAALVALAVPQSREDVDAVRAAVDALYRPWLMALADGFRLVVEATGYPRSPRLPALAEGDCVLFADGLRYDVGRMLYDRLVEGGMTVDLGWRWAAFPTVTATAKPDVSPVAELLGENADGAEFRPVVRAIGRPLTPDLFTRLLEERGVQRLASTETGDPSGRGWTEIGDLDTAGHQQGWKLARQVLSSVAELAARVAELVAAGWTRVRIVTDHGWLLLPSALPKVELPSMLTETRWGRCALLKPGSRSQVPTLPWTWNPAISVAYAPGISVFYAGMEYAHGGLTVQECVIPVLTVSVSRPPASVEISAVQWRALRCRIRVVPWLPGLSVDLRARVADPSSSAVEPTGEPPRAQPKAVGEDGTVSLPAREEMIGSSVFVVVLDANGAVLARTHTTVGGDT